MRGCAWQTLIALLIALRGDLATISVTINGGGQIIPGAVVAFLVGARVASANDGSITTDEHRLSRITGHRAGVRFMHLA